MPIVPIMTGYIRPTLDAVKALEAALVPTYGQNWRLRIERESPGVWRCRWDTLTDGGEVLGGGSESFSVSLEDNPGA